MITVERLLAWFDPRGRLSRRAYGRLFIRLSLLSMALLCVSVWAGSQGWRDTAFVIAAGIPFAWLSSLALAVRRLHDRNRTGWWLAVYLLIGAVSLVPVERAYDAHPIPVAAYGFASFGFLLWFLFETLGRRGTPGPNRFGSDQPE